MAANDHLRPRDSHAIPALWEADAECETGSKPANWSFRAGVYEGGIAFYYTTWDSWKIHVPQARPFDHAYEAPGWVQALVAQWGLDNFNPSHISRWGCLWHESVWRFHK